MSSAALAKLTSSTQTNNAECYMTVQEAASVARIHAHTIWRMIRSGRVQAYGYAGNVRVLLSEVLPVYKPLQRPDQSARLKELHKRAKGQPLSKRSLSVSESAIQESTAAAPPLTKRQRRSAPPTKSIDTEK